MLHASPSESLNRMALPACICFCKAAQICLQMRSFENTATTPDRPGGNSNDVDSLPARCNIGSKGRIVGSRALPQKSVAVNTERIVV